ncbi:type IV secretory system conjugative DNA transfer family protein [Caballeronia sp. KNU42]
MFSRTFSSASVGPQWVWGHRRRIVTVLVILVAIGGTLVVNCWLAGAIFFALNRHNPLHARLWSWPGAVLYHVSGQWPEQRPNAGRTLAMSAWLAGLVGLGIPALGASAVLDARSRRELHGSARFATAAEIRRAGLMAPEGIVVGKYRGRYLMFSGQQFIFVAAPTRSGKGASAVIPNLLNFSESVVVLDIKQENFNATAGFRAQYGQEVYLFNPFAEDFRTHRYNLLSSITDGVFRVGDILAIGYALYPRSGYDSFWADQARNLFLGIVLLLCELRDARRTDRTRAADIPDYPVTMGEVLRQSSGNGTTVKIYLRRMLDQYRDTLSGACINALNRFLANDDKVLASVLATFNAPLTIWSNPIVDAATSANDFDLKDVRRKRMSIYIGITPDHLAEAALLINLVFSQLVNLNTKQMPQDNPALKYACLLLMDEFTAIGKVHIIVKAVSYMAAYNLRLLPVVQSIAQLESVMGRADARTFITNHAMQIAFAPREQKDANEYSEMLGYFTEKARSKSQPRGWSAKRGASENVSDQRRPLMMAQELKEIGADKEIIFLENTKPILADKIRYYDDPVFQARLVNPPPVRKLDVTLFLAKIDGRLRAVTVDDIDPDIGRLRSLSAEYLECLDGWRPGDLPGERQMLEWSETVAYVDTYFRSFGIPEDAITQAELSLARIESTPVSVDAPLPESELAGLSRRMFSAGTVVPIDSEPGGSRKRKARAASREAASGTAGERPRRSTKRAEGRGDLSNEASA